MIEGCKPSLSWRCCHVEHYRACRFAWLLSSLGELFNGSGRLVWRGVSLVASTGLVATPASSTTWSRCGLVHCLVLRVLSSLTLRLAAVFVPGRILPRREQLVVALVHLAGMLTSRAFPRAM